MANKEIDELTTATLPLDGTEEFHIKQGANSRRLSTENMALFAGKGPLAVGLGRAQFTQPDDIFTAYDSATPAQNAFDATTRHWVIEHDGADGISLALESVSAGDFDIVYALSCQMLDGNQTALSLGLTIGDGVDHINFIVEGDTGTDIQWLKNYRDTDRFTFVSTNSTRTITGPGPFGGYPHLIYLRVERVSTDLSFYSSHNGFDWEEIFTATDTENNMSTVNEVGVFINSTGETENNHAFVRVVGRDDGPQIEAKTGGGTLPVAFKGFRVTKSGSNQTPGSFVSELVTFETVEHDSESGFNTTNDDEYIVPGSVDGKYMVFMAGVDTTGVVDGRISVRLNGTNVGSNWFENAFYGQVVTPPILVAEDDLVDVEVNMGAVAIQTGVQTFFGGFVVETSEDAFDYVEDTGTARTLTEADFKGNRTLELTNASAITVTLDTGVTAAGPVTIIQGGAGTITISGTATIDSNGSLTSSGGQDTAMTLIPTSTADTYKLIGTLS